MPNISTAKPIRISAMCCMVRFLEICFSRIAPIAVIALRDSVLSSSSAGDPPLTLERQMIHPVMLVPITAPMMTAIACRSFIIAEFTKPTTITLVAEEDWITAVTPVPSRIPLSGLLDSR